MLSALQALLDGRPTSLRSIYTREAERVRAAAAPGPTVTDDDLAPLPLPVQAYLRRAGAVGRPRVRSFYARMRVQIRNGRDGDWMDSTAEQVNTYGPASRRFFMHATRGALSFDALHRFVGEHATMRVKALGLVTMVDARGPEMDQSETVTLFNDLCLFAPAALIEAEVAWEPVSERVVRGRFTHYRRTVSAELRFDEAGDLVDFVSPDRYLSADGKVFRRLPWSTPVSSYGSFNGARAFAKAEARWREPDGEWAYGRFELAELRHNPTL